MLKVSFKAKLFKSEATDKIGSGILLVLPKEASAKLPSKGMTLVEGTMNGFHLKAVLEPDGKGSHWFRVSEAMRKAAKADIGEMITLVIEPTKEWPEPKIPADLKKALSTDPKANTIWMDVTPMARWDWIRWIGATRNLETRNRRVEVACSKLRSGMRRPCCFDRTQCTLTDA